MLSQAPANEQTLHDAHQAHALATALQTSIARDIVGQTETVRALLTALFAGGHALLVGVPGLAKTMLVRTLAQALQLPFARIQFTPDLMPTDITGGQMLDTHDGVPTLRFERGPVFHNILLADEINRTPPKTQAALLESMQEGAVTAGGERHALPRPFHVFATQNPLEQEGTYPLPEAQLDRFMLQITLDYPSADAELAIARPAGATHTSPTQPSVQPSAISLAALTASQALVRYIPVPEPLLQAIVRLVRSTRPGDDAASDDTLKTIAYGAGPRASQHLVRLAQAHALVSGRYAVEAADLQALAAPALRHRLIPQPELLGNAAAIDATIAQLLARALDG